MRRDLWIALGMAGGLIVALMIASLLLQQQARTVVNDLRAPVASLRDALQKWDRKRVAECTDGISDELYAKWFEDYHSDDPARKRLVAGIFSALGAFPSVRFDGCKPDRVTVQYDVHDGASRGFAAASFAPRPAGGWTLTAVRFPVASDDNNPATPIVFAEGEAVSLTGAVERLFSALMGSGSDDFRALMLLDKGADAEKTSRLFDDLRTQVMACGSDRLTRMLPVVGPLPRGTRWFRITISAPVDDKPLRLDLTIEPKQDGPPGIRRFTCSTGREPATPTTPADNAPNATGNSEKN